MERTVELGLLLAYYGQFLTKRQQVMLHLHANEDLSLSEIAEREGISRQGVHDALRRAEAQLRKMEQRLGLLYRTMETRRGLHMLEEQLSRAEMPAEEREALLAAIASLKRLWEENDGV